jgi:hypothetical protein
MVECSKEAVRDGLGAEFVGLGVSGGLVCARLAGNSGNASIVACLMGRGGK